MNEVFLIGLTKRTFIVFFEIKDFIKKSFVVRLLWESLYWNTISLVLLVVWKGIEYTSFQTISGLVILFGYWEELPFSRLWLFCMQFCKVFLIGKFLLKDFCG